MVSLLSIQSSKASTTYPNGYAVRCTLLADDTSTPLPTTGGGVAGMQEYTEIAPGSVAVTPAGDIAIMDNSGEWGLWL